MNTFTPMSLENIFSSEKNSNLQETWKQNEFTYILHLDSPMWESCYIALPYSVCIIIIILLRHLKINFRHHVPLSVILLYFQRIRIFSYITMLRWSNLRKTNMGQKLFNT